MKKTLIMLVAFGLVFSFALPLAAAAVEVVEEGSIEDDGDAEVVTLDSPFYFLGRLMEDMHRLLTYDQEKKVALLEELVEKRAKELEALDEKFTGEELTEAERGLLEAALDDLVSYVEKLLAEIEVLEDEGQEEDGEEEEANGIENDDETGEDGDKVSKEDYEDKYAWRIAHLTAIQDRAPEAAHMGLARAIANAERQHERAMARGENIADEDEDDTENDNAVGDDNVLEEVEFVIEAYALDDGTETTDDVDEDIGRGREKNKDNGNGLDKDKRTGPPKDVPGKGVGLQKQQEKNR